MARFIRRLGIWPIDTVGKLAYLGGILLRGVELKGWRYDDVRCDGSFYWRS
jgi:hypothetical protein